jgi:hypothetical protein
MNPALRAEIVRLGGDPTDQTWEWLLFRGPHGSSFTWGQTRNEPPGYVGLEHLRQIVAEYSENNAEFGKRALIAARASLSSSFPDIVRRGIQVIAVIGDETDAPRIKSLTANENESIKADAKACSFELKQRMRRKPIENSIL